MTDWATAVPPHLFISGDTGAGKTTLATQLHVEAGRVSIFIDPMGVCERGRVVDSVAGLKQALRGGYGMIVFRPHWNDDEAYEQVREVVDLIFRLSDVLGAGFQIIADECHRYAPKHDSGSPLVRVVKEGRNFDVKGINLTQEPQTVAHSVLRLSYNVWIGGVNEYAREYLEGYNVPVAEIKKNGPHEALVLDKNMEPVERTQAAAKYATDT